MELRAKEKIIDHITEAKNPTNGKAINAVEPDPKRPKVKQMMAKFEKKTKTLLQPKIFKRSNPVKQPIVISPQNLDTIFAPVT